MPRRRARRRAMALVGCVAAAVAHAMPVDGVHRLQRRDVPFQQPEQSARRMRRIRVRSDPADDAVDAVHSGDDKGVGTSKDTQMHDASARADTVEPNAKGKEREHAPQAESPHRRQMPAGRKPRKERLLRFTSQRSPFHSSEIGAMASRQPAALSVGLFRSDYPYRPSGRRKVRDSDAMHTRNGQHQGQGARAEKATFESLYNVPEDVANGNVFKKGWTRWMLDDDMRLAVPNDARKPRRNTAVAMASNAIGRKWYRWKPGEGYVLSRYKDYSTYKNGPGIALGQLLPPRERPTVGRIPFIPNDSKRDLVWLIVVWLFALTALALAAEVRAHLRAHRKGKRRSAEVVPSIRVFHDGVDGGDGGGSESSPLRVTSFGSGGKGGLRTRQRTQARNFRDICKAALFPTGSGGTGGKTPSSRRLTTAGQQRKATSRVESASSMAMRNLRWVASSASATIANGSDGGKGGGNGGGGGGGITTAQDVLPTIHQHPTHIKQRYSDDGHSASTDEMFPGRLMRRGRSVSPYMGPEQQTTAQETSWAAVQLQDSDGGGGGGHGSTRASMSNTSNESVSSNGGGSHTHVRSANYQHHSYHPANGFAIPYPAKEA